MRRHSGNGAVVVIGHIIERGHINAFDLRGRLQKLFLAPAFRFRGFQQIEHLVEHLFAFAETKQIKKRRHRFGVAHARAAADHDRRKVRSVGSADRQPGKVEHIQHIRVAKLIHQCKADEVERFDRVAALKRIQRQIPFAHERFHIVPRGKHALAPDVVSGVCAVI